MLFLGPPGVGKSHLAAALGVRAIKNGFSVAHFVLDDLMHVLRADAAVPPARLRARRYFNCALLIVDEVGFRPLDRVEANLFFPGDRGDFCASRTTPDTIRRRRPTIDWRAPRGAWMRSEAYACELSSRGSA